MRPCRRADAENYGLKRNPVPPMAICGARLCGGNSGAHHWANHMTGLGLSDSVFPAVEPLSAA